MGRSWGLLSAARMRTLGAILIDRSMYLHLSKQKCLKPSNVSRDSSAKLRDDEKSAGSENSSLLTLGVTQYTLVRLAHWRSHSIF